MAEFERTTIGESGQMKKRAKRKRTGDLLTPPSPEEKHAKIAGFRDEINSLVGFCRDLGFGDRGSLLGNTEKVPNSLNGAIACLIEESDLPLSKLVDLVFEKVKGINGIGDGVSKASVKSTVLIIGQRASYGVVSADADCLEDESESALWCWETRDLNFIPKLTRASLKAHRTCRKKVRERISAVSAMITALEKSEDRPSCLQELTKASEKLNKVLNEADIRLLMESVMHKSGAEMTEKDSKREEKSLLKQLEKNKRDAEIARKKMDRKLEKEKLQSEKELKRLHDEAEKEERRREKEENEMQKQLKKQQEEAEKEQRRKEKEEAELRKHHAHQKQESMLKRFLSKNKTNASSQNDSLVNKATAPSSSNMLEKVCESVTLAMDSILVQSGGVEVETIWSSHLVAWRLMGRSMHSNRKMHWGIRRNPKTELVKELKLTTNKEVNCDDDINAEKFAAGWVDSNSDNTLYRLNTDERKRIQVKKLLQFDKSHRPAFYGVWPKESHVVAGRHPFVKDPDIEYEIDSDEEWEEDEPGENLSDCDKDEEEDSVEGNVKDEDEDESEDEFVVPDGYLSENEGVNNDEMKSDDLDEGNRTQPNSIQQSQSEELCTLLRQQKCLNNLTEHALKKNYPMIILNLMHEKNTLLSVEELSGTEKIERMCLQVLSVRPLPDFPELEISNHSDVVNEENEASLGKSSLTTSATGGAVILDSDMPQIISLIQSCSNGIEKIVKLLHDKFPAVPKSHLRNKVREISDFVDNRWQVKKEVLSKYGLSISPEKSRLKTTSIVSFLKRCAPPSGMNKDLGEVSPQPSKKLKATDQDRLGGGEDP